MANTLLKPRNMLARRKMAARVSSADASEFAVASQWRLMWWKFRKHRLAVVSLVIVSILYTVALFAGFFAPQNKATYNRHYTEAPPQDIHWFDNGKFGPILWIKTRDDPRTFARNYAIDKEIKIPLAFL